MSGISRRSFGGVTAAALSGLNSVTAEQAGSRTTTAQRKDYYSFPKDFTWGAATASYQVEGAASEDGRKPSTWDTYSKTPGRVFQGDTGDIACDHYHRYAEDIRLMTDLGIKAYRFSIAWPRVFPEGDGRPNPKGLDFYNRLVDGLLKAGITPYCTLFHWDLPQSLETRYGGWRDMRTVRAFADYAAYVGKNLGSKIDRFFTINEFSCFIDEGYGSGTKAPGHKLSDAVRNQARHHAVYAHGLAVQALRANAPKALVGIAENPSLCVPVIESPDHMAAAGKAMRELNAHFLTAVMEGRYTDAYLRSAGAAAPRFKQEELKVAASRLDFVGLNIYTPTYVRADAGPAGYAVVPNPESYPHMASPWLTIGPQIAYWAPRHMKEIWNVNAVYVTENGCSSTDVPAPDGKVYDTDRVMYVRNHLEQGHRAVMEGWPLKGYFWWSLMDNFEWNDGYSKRFGVYYVDFKTQKRSPKLSADFYKETIRRNAVV